MEILSLFAYLFVQSLVLLFGWWALFLEIKQVCLYAPDPHLGICLYPADLGTVLTFLLLQDLPYPDNLWVIPSQLPLQHVHVMPLILNEQFELIILNNYPVQLSIPSIPLPIQVYKLILHLNKLPIQFLIQQFNVSVLYLELIHLHPQLLLLSQLVFELSDMLLKLWVVLLCYVQGSGLFLNVLSQLGYSLDYLCYFLLLCPQEGFVLLRCPLEPCFELSDDLLVLI